MDNSKWAFAPDTPDWPIDAQGEGEGRSADQQVRLHPPIADMLISLWRPIASPASSILTTRAAQERSSTAFPATAPACMFPPPAGGRQGILEAQPVEEPEQPQE